MKIIAAIPARYNSTRFPGKLLKRLGKRTVIEQTYLNTYKTDLFDEVYVITDNVKIKSTISSIGGKVIMSKSEFQCGTDRISSAISGLEADIIVNVQGDEPFIDKESLSSLINCLKNDKNSDFSVTSLMTKITDTKQILDPNTVKVITDNDDYAIYFSRSAIPFKRDNIKKFDHYKHIGIYGFRYKTLKQFSLWKLGPLEKSEQIEGIRFIENQKKIKMITTDFLGVSIDTLDDLLYANSIWPSNE
ncbi:MAG: 3-deoxy-manno-octulosonate cytidylyltransferase [Flavobacteriaceae bacterium]|nr:3-deoxy-manno-octulosonate cytidylyltransferase [Flavobacteriaceae bacterium]